MRTNALTLAAAFCLTALVAGCPADKKTDTFGGGAGAVVITASKSTVLANGTNFVDLTVTNTTGSAVTLTLSPAGRGTLSATSVAGAAGTVTLTTCVAGVGTCTGVATVTATGGGATDSVNVTFSTLASMCPTDCTADAGCLGQSCNGGTGYTCSGTFPALSCTAPGSGGGGGSGALGSLVPADPPVQYRVLGAAGSGWQEYGWVQVQVLDDAGNPFADGTTVHFEHKKLGGSTLAAPTVACVPASANCVAHDSIVAGGKGLASVWLYAGTVAGTLQVTATVTAGAITRSIAMPTVAVVGAKANGANFSIVCSPRNVPALAEHDCSVSWVDAPYTCVALAKDRYNNLLGTATQVIFASEAAAVGQVVTTPEYDPGTDGASQADLGSAVQIFNTLGAGLPFDVTPDAAVSEPSSSHGLDGCGTRTHNPRDGVVTVIAVADGEEAFFDTNGNGVYNAGEPFVDQGEPFVDANDNGVWDAGESFLDVDGNGAYTVRNGAWDGNTKIWTQTVVVFTGKPETVPGGGANLLGTRWASTLVNSCTPTAPDAGFAVTPGTPPTTQTHYVYASDMNLNFLSTDTSYTVDVVVGEVAADYLGFAKFADYSGISYRNWPCDQAGNCAAQCRSTTNLPCVMTPAITGFRCGLAAEVVITGGSTSDPGTDVVRWLPTTTYSRYGTDISWTHFEPLTGTNN